MALGGGTWTRQNKVLPGTYINFSSASKASAGISDRGIVSIPFSLSWGPEKDVFELNVENIETDCISILGYRYSAPEMQTIREVFKHARTVFAYRLNVDTVKASNIYAVAKYGGARGNDIKISIAENLDTPTLFDVITYLDNQQVDKQTVETAAELKPNSYVVFKHDITLVSDLGVSLENGTDGTGITGDDYQNFLNAVESYSFNILGCPTDDTDITRLFIAYTKRLCNDLGANFQLVCYRPGNADSEVVIGLENAVVSADGTNPEYGLVYWLAGAQAGCDLGASLTNTQYDGEYEINLAYTQAELSEGIKAGKFLFHKVNGAAKVLADVNTYISFTERKGVDFQQNQTMRILSALANDSALLFNTKYLGIMPNDADGRVSLWNDLVTLYQEYEKLHAIEGFEPESLKVVAGDTKKSVLCTAEALNIVNAMEQLYLNIIMV